MLLFKIWTSLFFIAISSISLFAKAQDDNSPASLASEADSPTSPSREAWGLSLGTLVWNQPLTVQDGLVREKDVANHKVFTVSLQRDSIFKTWGWSAQLFVGTGTANGGGNTNTLTYEKNNIPLTVYGINPRIYHRLSNRITPGISLLVFMKNISWPKDSPTQNLDSDRNLIVMPLVDLNFRISRKWDFSTGLGPATPNSTLWKIGILHRL